MITFMSKNYYTYAYLRLDGTPYYIGRGKGKRAYSSNHRVGLPPKDRILILKKDLSFSESVRHEMYMISVLGRKDIGTGILRNLTDGGEGVKGYTHRPESKSRISSSRMGIQFSDEHRAKLSEVHSGVNLSDEHRSRISEGLLGDKHPRWKLSEKQRKEIAQRYIPRSPEGNGNSAALAKEFETTATSIRRIAQDPRWTF